MGVCVISGCVCVCVCPWCVDGSVVVIMPGETAKAASMLLTQPEEEDNNAALRTPHTRMGLLLTDS
jgi:hypothetical protein